MTTPRRRSWDRPRRRSSRYPSPTPTWARWRPYGRQPTRPCASHPSPASATPCPSTSITMRSPPTPAASSSVCSAASTTGAMAPRNSPPSPAPTASRLPSCPATPPTTPACASYPPSIPTPGPRWTPHSASAARPTPPWRWTGWHTWLASPRNRPPRHPQSLPTPSTRSTSLAPAPSPPSSSTAPIFCPTTPPPSKPWQKRCATRASRSARSTPTA
jgi:hypothetical protein